MTTKTPLPRRSAAPKCGHCHDQPASYVCSCGRDGIGADLHHVCYDCNMSMVLSHCGWLTDALERAAVQGYEKSYATGRAMVQAWRENDDVTKMLGALARLAKAVGL